MASAYFADSFYWIALTHRKDASHRRVTAWASANRKALLITTEEVLAEVLTWYSAKGMLARGAVVAAVQTFLNGPNIRVLPQTSAGFQEAFALYAARPDKEYSLTDCRSMAAMKSLGLTEVLSNDRHFSQEGFAVSFP